MPGKKYSLGVTQYSPTHFIDKCWYCK